MTMTLVNTITVSGGGQSTIEFTGIPQSGTDLLLVLSLRTSSQISGFGYNNTRVTVNGSMSITDRFLTGGVSSTSSFTDTVLRIDAPSSSGAAGVFSTSSVYLPNYANTTINKTFSADKGSSATGSNVGYLIEQHASYIAATTAVTSIGVTVLGDNSPVFVAGSMASLYLITKGSGGATVS